MNYKALGFTVQSEVSRNVLLQNRIHSVEFDKRRKQIKFFSHTYPAFNTKQARDALSAIYNIYLEASKSKPFAWSYFDGKPTTNGYKTYEFSAGFYLYLRRDEESGKTYVTDAPDNPEGEIEYFSISDFIDAAWLIYNMSDVPF